MFVSNPLCGTYAVRISNFYVINQRHIKESSGREFHCARLSSLSTFSKNSFTRPGEIVWLVKLVCMKWSLVRQRSIDSRVVVIFSLDNSQLCKSYRHCFTSLLFWSQSRLIQLIDHFSEAILFLLILEIRRLYVGYLVWFDVAFWCKTSWFSIK
jgi:hypothetical protein